MPMRPSLRWKFGLLKLCVLWFILLSVSRKNGLKLPQCPQLVQEFQYQQWTGCCMQSGAEQQAETSLPQLLWTLWRSMILTWTPGMKWATWSPAVAMVVWQCCNRPGTVQMWTAASASESPRKLYHLKAAPYETQIYDSVSNRLLDYHFRPRNKNLCKKKKKKIKWNWLKYLPPHIVTSLVSTQLPICSSVLQDF